MLTSRRHPIGKAGLNLACEAMARSLRIELGLDVADPLSVKNLGVDYAQCFRSGQYLTSASLKTTCIDSLS